MPKRGRPSTLTGSIAELATIVGGIQALASQLDVNVRTIRYWANNGRTPSGPARKLLEHIAAVHGIGFLGDIENDKKASESPRTTL